MSLDSAKAKMLKLKKQLETTYHTSHDNEQKKRVALQLKKLKHELDGFGDFDEEIDLDAMDFIADILDQEKTNDDAPFRVNENDFKSRIPIECVSGKARDVEMDQIYSYLLFFHRNFFPVFQPDITQLDYKNKAKMEDAFIHYNYIHKYIKEYKNDVGMMQNTTREKELELYCQRLTKQKNHLIIKLNKVLIEFEGLLSELTAEDALYSSLLNPSEFFSNKPSLPYYSSYEGESIFDILTECIKFLAEYRKLLRAPA